ncbi:hypothetical protein BLFGPEAP_01100 [Candidatus Methanoperedenaceae archaeon GB50]|nr:hypothetical protein BLFGPEAP_01100 [Candidatus Methanoperedenaceae archaeon GB50]
MEGYTAGPGHRRIITRTRKEIEKNQEERAEKKEK